MDGHGRPQIIKEKKWTAMDGHKISMEKSGRPVLLKGKKWTAIKFKRNIK
jgi:hypothetical protein